eukprot:jgi/Bigna1/74917/fgenesh1_pg.31_\
MPLLRMPRWKEGDALAIYDRKRVLQENCSPIAGPIAIPNPYIKKNEEEDYKQDKEQNVEEEEKGGGAVAMALVPLPKRHKGRKLFREAKGLELRYLRPTGKQGWKIMTSNVCRNNDARNKKSELLRATIARLLEKGGAGAGSFHFQDGSSTLRFNRGIFHHIGSKTRTAMLKKGMGKKGGGYTNPATIGQVKVYYGGCTTASGAASSTTPVRSAPRSSGIWLLPNLYRLKVKGLCWENTSLGFNPLEAASPIASTMSSKHAEKQEEGRENEDRREEYPAGWGGDPDMWCLEGRQVSNYALDDPHSLPTTGRKWFRLDAEIVRELAWKDEESEAAEEGYGNSCYHYRRYIFRLLDSQDTQRIYSRFRLHMTPIARDKMSTTARSQMMVKVPFLELFGVLNPLKVEISYPVLRPEDRILAFKAAKPSVAEAATFSCGELTLQGKLPTPSDFGPRLFVEFSLKMPKIEAELRARSTGDVPPFKMVEMGRSRDFYVMMRQQDSRSAAHSKLKQEASFDGLMRMLQQNGTLSYTTNDKSSVNTSSELSSGDPPVKRDGERRGGGERDTVKGYSRSQDEVLLHKLSAPPTISPYTNATTVIDVQVYKSCRNKHDFNVNLKNSNGETLLMRAASLGRMELAIFLLDDGCRVNARDIYGESALMRASYCGHATIVDLLLERKANASLPDHGGITPLMLAAENGNDEIIYDLLEHHADPRQQCQAGFTAIDLARSNGHHEMARTMDHIDNMLTVQTNVLLKHVILM